MPDPAPAKTRPLRVIFVLVAMALVLLMALTWLNRRALAREALTGWLKSKGVASSAEVEAFGPTSFTARLSVGDPKRPDFAAERVEVRYRPRLTGIEVVSVRLTKPVLRAQYRGGKLGVGALDPIVQDFLRRPPRPSARQPRIVIDGGILELATDYGPVRVAANARVEDGKLQSLAATSAPATLKGKGFDLALGQATIREVTRGGRIEADLDAPLTAATAGGATVREGRLTVRLEAPYPDLVKRKGDGPVTIRANLTGQRLAAAGRGAGQHSASATFIGQSTGWITNLTVTGKATVAVKANGVDLGSGKAQAVQATLASDDVRWTREGGDRLTASARGSGTATGVVASDLQVDRLALQVRGSLEAKADALKLAVVAAADGHGRWTGLGAPTQLDGPQLIAVKRAARGFRVTAPAVRADLALVRGVAKTNLRLDQPVRLLPDTGGEARLTAGAWPWRVKVSGGGLPELDATIRRATFGAVTTADLSVRARGSVAFVQDGALTASGRLRIADGGATFTADRCATFSAVRLEFGANDVEALGGRLCATGRPLFRFERGDWSLAGRAEGVGASVPFLQAKAVGGGGPVSAASRRGRITADLQVTAARLEDTAPATRFNPLNLSGQARLANLLWEADLVARQPDGAPVGTAHLAHDSGLGVGFVVMKTDTLTFAEGGRQPAQLSPLVSVIGSPAVGTAGFEGRFDWAPVGAGSSGTLTIPGLDFQSPAGPVKGLKGELVFKSLAPLIAAPGQSLEIAEIGAIVPLTGVRAGFELGEKLLTVTGGEASVGGGKVRVETLEIPLVPGEPTKGVLILEGVQLHDLIEASPFGDKVDLDAKVSGRLAFEANGNKVRISAGELKAIQPGRLSIDRTALTGVQADGAVTGPPAAVDPNATFTDFAYQAMEHLAFDTLEATVASREDGRLGVLFHIVGRHDPPTKQVIKLSVMDLIQKRFLGKPLPLPSGTGVNLTLDTTLNLDDLLADYADFRRLHGSGEVQP